MVVWKEYGKFILAFLLSYVGLYLILVALPFFGQNDQNVRDVVLALGGGILGGLGYTFYARAFPDIVGKQV